MDLLTTVPDDKFTRTLVLLALEIPRLSGFEILKRLQFDDRLCRTRVIILTSSTDRPVIDRVYKLGACGCIRTPQTSEELAATVKAVAVYWIDRNVTPFDEVWI